MLATIVALVGLIISLATNNWIPFAIAVVIAFGLGATENMWLHDHMHKLYEGEEDEHGVKTIE